MLRREASGERRGRRAHCTRSLNQTHFVSSFTLTMRRAAAAALLWLPYAAAFASARFTLPPTPRAQPVVKRYAEPAPSDATPPADAFVPLEDGAAAPPAPALPAAPSAKLVAFLWANTLLLGPVAVVGAFMGAKVLGDGWALSAGAVRLGVLYAAPWIALSFVPLDKWFPSMADVTAHTELITASALGVEFGGFRRCVGVVLATTLISTSAGLFEEAAFRGVFQRAAKWLFLAAGGPAAGLVGAVGLERLATVAAVAAVSGCFGALHNYCRGYALLAALAGAYFGLVYALTGNLLVAAVTHATVDLVAFLTCYVSLCTRSQADKDTLAAKSFKVTDALRATRANFDAAPAANGAA